MSEHTFETIWIGGTVIIVVTMLVMIAAYALRERTHQRELEEIQNGTHLSSPTE
jgi:hypothetical protein